MLQAKHKTGLVFFPAFDWAIDPGHPEREERLLYTQDQVFEEGLLDIDGIKQLTPELVTMEDVQRVHFCVPDAETIMTESHRISAGGAKAVGRAVMDKTVDRGFALVRPPGHHAMRMVHGGRGFCLINIEAIMLEYLRAKYHIRKVAIVDTDCHHGDGSQDVYWHDPDTLFISIHQDGRTLYPGSGFTNELGGANAIGKTLNIPLPPRTSTEGYLHVIKNVVQPILADFKPDLIVNSAGQDNHYTDPLTNMNFSAQGYADLTAMLNPDIAVLEGGYSIEGALPYVNVGIILAMAGIDYRHVTEPDYDPDRLRQSDRVTDEIKKTGDTILKFWENRDFIRSEWQKKHTDFHRRTRNVYYDTDNITEFQDETIRICPDCGGAYKIESSADRGYRVLAIHVPRHACQSCQQLAHDWFDDSGSGDYDKAFLQDRVNDRFLEKDFRKS
jgi:acetoin utilization deacetylase AcuC-like enzyme